MVLVAPPPWLTTTSSSLTVTFSPSTPVKLALPTSACSVVQLRVSVASVGFDKGEDVYVVVSVTDGFDTTTSTSSTLTVSNTPPEAPVVTIDPSDAVAGEDLFCEVTTASTDADGDTVTYTLTNDAGGLFSMFTLAAVPLSLARFLWIGEQDVLVDFSPGSPGVVCINNSQIRRP